jgi:ribosomal protein L11 methyltransferase
LRKFAPFDVVTANILARPLCKFAPKLAAALAPDGVAILSGLLEWQEAMVMGAHRRQGLTLKSRLVIDGWATLIIGR